MSCHDQLDDATKARDCARSEAADSSDPLQQTAVILPALDEERSIELVLSDLPDVAIAIVVDNGSRDRTAELARAAGAHVVSEPTPGYGRACRVGIHELRRLRRRARESKFEQAGENGFSALRDIKYVAFLDADYSDHPELLPLLLQPIQSDAADFVLGSRLRGDRESGSMPFQARVGNKLACFLMRILWGASYSDLGPFRAIRLDHLNRLCMQDRNFGWTVEMQIKACQHGLRMIEVPVPYRRRVGTSKISGTISGTIRAGYKILYTIGKYWLLGPETRK